MYLELFNFKMINYEIMVDCGRFYMLLFYKSLKILKNQVMS